MERILLFRTQEVDSTTGVRGSGNEHLTAFNADAVESFSVLQGQIRIHFSTTEGSIVGTKMTNKPLVKLKIKPGTEFKTLISLIKFLKENTATITHFDNVKKLFPLENIREVSAITTT